MNIQQFFSYGIISLLLTACLGNVPVERYQDATYSIDGMSVTLADETVRMFGNEAIGDINGDGTSDVVFLFTQDDGGSGTFFYVVAALKSDKGYLGTNAVFLGDRIAPQTTEIHDGDIVVNYVVRAPQEPMTADPSVGVSMYLTMSGGVLYPKK